MDQPRIRTVGQWLALSPIQRYGPPKLSVLQATSHRSQVNRKPPGGDAMRRALLIIGLVALAIGLLWIGQGTGVIPWPKTSFMINQIQWAGYGAALSAVG